MESLVSGVALLAASALVAGAPGAHAQGRIAAEALSRPDLTDLGSAPADTRVTVAITLNYRDKARLDDLVLQQGTPGSPLYHQFLTPADFAQQFGPTQTQHDAVVAALRGAGFTILQTYPNRTVIDATAPVGAVGAYFRTQFHLFNQAGHGLRYGNAVAATLPAALGDIVSTVAGLDNVVKARPHHKAVGVFYSGMQLADAGAQAAVTPVSAPIERTVAGQFAGLYPAALADAYKFPSLAGKTGAGRSIAIVIDSNITNGNLATFWKAAGVTRRGSFNRILVNGVNPGVNDDVGETAIDTETTSSLAPGANIDLYLISSLNDAPIEDAYNLVVSNNVDDVASSSFGGCELDDTPFAIATDAIAEQGAALGITFTASTGDACGDCEDETAMGKNFYSPDIVSSPSSGPHFVAVGGTTLLVNAATGARVSETAWAPGGSAGGGGGGVSSFWALPSYQAGLTRIAVVPTITVKSPDLQPNGGFAGRNLPDISLDAANTVGSYIAVYDTLDGGWTGYGGTSVANPVFATLVALQNQKTGSRSGFLNPALYAAFTNNGASPSGVYGADFYDVTSGNIGAGWSAKAGYDQATGIGSILGGAF